MKRNIVVLLLCAAAILSTVSGAVVYELYYPGQARIPEETELSAFLDGLPWSNGTLIQYGDVEPGWSYSKNLTVVNTGNTQLTVGLYVSGLEPGWSLSWAANGTLLDPGDAAIGNLILDVPANGIAGTYNWIQYVRGY